MKKESKLLGVWLQKATYDGNIVKPLSVLELRYPNVQIINNENETKRRQTKLPPDRAFVLAIFFAATNCSDEQRDEYVSVWC